MARLKIDMRSCHYCSHKKADISTLSYFCSNKQSEHYGEKINNHDEIISCKGGNAKGLYEK